MADDGLTQSRATDSLTSVLEESAKLLVKALSTADEIAETLGVVRDLPAELSQSERQRCLGLAGAVRDSAVTLTQILDQINAVV